MSNGYDVEKGAGWVAFAGVMIAFVAILDILWGIAAIANSHFLINGNHFVVQDRNAWGWWTLIIGVILLIAAFSIWNGHEFGRWIGIIFAALSAFGHLFNMRDDSPWWALVVIVIDILIIYALVVYGGRQGPAAVD